MNQNTLIYIVIISVIFVLSSITFGVSFKFQNDANNEGPFSDDYNIGTYLSDTLMQKIFFYGGISLFIFDLIIIFILIKKIKVK